VNPSERSLPVDVDHILASRADLIDLASRAMNSRHVLGGLAGSASALAIATIASRHPLVVVVPDVPTADALEDDLATIAAGKEVFRLRATSAAVEREPDPDSLYTTDDPEERVDLSERVQHLKALAAPRVRDIFVVPSALLLEALPAAAELAQKSVLLKKGARFDRKALETQLRSAGFAPRALVGAPGEVSLRGDILDVFPYGEKSPLRVEFFDDVVDSLRNFDAESQLSIAALESIAIPLLRREELRGGTPRASLLHEHLPRSVITVFLDSKRALDRLEEHAFTHATPQDRLRRAREFVSKAHGVEFQVPIADGAGDANLGALSVEGVGGGVDALEESIASLRKKNDRIVLLCESDGESKRMSRLLSERGIEHGETSALTLGVGHVRGGFQLTNERVAILNELELLGKPRLHRPRPKKSSIPLRTITNLLELHPGDHLVHQTHGVARFNGMMRMKRDAGEEDFLLLEFEGGTIFYLPAAKIDLVQRFVGPSGAAPRLDKIGGKSWAGKKAKVEAAMAEIAADLLRVQAARQSRPGAPHAHDEALVAEFERSFPFADTKDQAQATRDVHDDLDSRRPMDRLICGDVGFGKTEVAVRAAFRVVLGGKQVAILVPTTLLAEQHGETFERRFASYPVSIAVLSRFKSKKEQKSTTEKLQRGQIDIVIGTHRLLSKDIGFKDLGLIVVDEEQRFGVKAKETLKQMRASVDVLTLSATPIPRTLHMALVGLRDISALNTPPVGRRPVRTEIHRFDDGFVHRALLAELDRGGQAFVVHNRIASLHSVAERIASLAPTARVVIGHGQMDEDELDETIQKFKRGEADVLVSTSIVESGLDLPRANTMFIDRPEQFGLADLHQMRGRVGRSDVQAYCYLLVHEATLPDDAQRRLKALEELSHLGAGYDIAIKDLEIRGAGDLLSAAQSGHIGAVGYDLYCRLLAQAVARAKGERPPEPPADTDVDLGVVAFLPVEYVPDPGQRMEILRRMGSSDRAALSELGVELRDRFGRLPPPVSHLFAVFDLKRACRSHGIRRLLYPGDDHVLLELSEPRRFHKTSPFSAAEAAVLSNGLIHVRLPKNTRSPHATLDWLQARMPYRPSGMPAKEANK